MTVQYNKQWRVLFFACRLRSEQVLSDVIASDIFWASQELQGDLVRSRVDYIKLITYAYLEN